MRNRIHLSNSDAWLGRLERRLLTFLGPAQLGKVGKQPDRSKDRTAGVQGEWELRRDSTGRTYLVRAKDGEQSSEGTAPQQSPESRLDD